MKPSVAAVSVRKNSQKKAVDDLLVVEEPLEIRLEYGRADQRHSLQLAVTMRTPGQDHELTLGFLFTEGIIDHADQVRSIHYCENVKEEEKENVVRVILAENVYPDQAKLQRHFYTTSSCGVCGKTSLEAVKVLCPPAPLHGSATVSPETIILAPDKLRAAQQVFTHTGGLHAAGLFSIAGELIFLCEDIGRHNALDKLIGLSINAKHSPVDHFVLVSGRAGFELVQKAARAGFPMLVAVGAPSSLAVELAEEIGMTLVGFVRKNDFNVYTGGERVGRDL